MARKTAREYAYKLIFEYLFFENDKDFSTSALEIFFNDVSLLDEDKAYVREVYNGVVEHFDELKAAVMQYAKGYTVDRIFKPDMSAMLLAIYEMRYMQNIPHAVSVNECVELVKTYGTEKSGGYVNGILASVIKDL